ncbi:triose phosphate transporter, putative [Plasmodium chabaudi chabaudi]|uniref:Triose phosphate transporter, putative n=1 Tax=Plasmodium chabaudi chabaudi TaxID=31271 RepID=A0A077TKH0_PLACU|nr:triose phosphate transporter, putative [Plasmodium chabaudi chabaudi]SCM23384.1 triose phosphate transporter, putative [Plasmodium chabaudi chabaudi]SCN60912.1 triose phosphate transporter, putative [Plasmodium chabaudi chabaudi]VTZ69072.1 triose phosphate transporter, putative [Plasmodium chabaudi chabaudi]|eukprot:XP_745978.2 triose phosphate transporter, putative [Plasmodium chabaudi chabaudi]
MMKDNDKNEYGTFPITINENYGGKFGDFQYKKIYRALYEKAVLGFLFLSWYGLNVIYNVENKKVLNITNLPWTASCAQLFVGWLFILTYWGTGYKKIPKIFSYDIFFKNITIQSVCHIMVHSGAIISMSSTSVSFTHVIKACEPVFTAILSIILLKQYFKFSKYVCLVIIVGGVICASAKEINFTIFAFISALISNFGSSLRAIYVKKMMLNKSSIGENLTGPNIYALITIFSALISLPFVFIFEGKQLYRFITEFDTTQSKHTLQEVYVRLFLSGVWYYLNNEFAFMCLERVNQVTHAVANSLKRIVIIVSSIIIFKTHVTFLGAAGSATTIIGAFLYSIV